MKGPIPDLSKPSPFGVLLHDKYAKSIAEGNAIPVTIPMSEPEAVKAIQEYWTRYRDFISDEFQFAEIQRQVQ